MQSVAKLNAIRCVFSLLFSIKLTYKQIIIQTYTYVNSIIYILYTFICLGLENIIMTLFERIKSLANQRDKSMKEVALELGFSENLFYRWKTTEPKARDLQKVADYFDVSVDFLLGREERETPKFVDLSENDTVFSFDGKEISKETMRKAIAIAKALEENE